MATLSKDDQRRIDAIVEDLRERTGLSYPENSLLEFAEALGIKVVFADLSTIGSSVSGVIQYDDGQLKTNPRVYISSKIASNRRTFTLGHELGHHLLHQGNKLRVDDFDYSDQSKEAKDESESNYFAAALLVPAPLLKFEMKKTSSITELAEKFQVSPSALEARINWIRTN